MAALSRALLLLLCTLLARSLEAANANVKLERGVYQNIVLGIKGGTEEPLNGTDFLDQLRVFLNQGSDALHYATDGTASFGDVTLVLPRSWDKSKFGHVEPALPAITTASADILLHDTPNTIPDTLQAELCGVPGRQIRLPIAFLNLNAEQEQVYGTPGRILTHEWAHYRWGAHDEHGFSRDLVYRLAYGQKPTSCAAGTMEGTYLTDCSSTSRCASSDSNVDCYYCFNNTATPETVQASLGYLPAMSTGKFCTSATHNRDSPSQHNLLCGKRSVTEVIEAHPDALNMTAHTVAQIKIFVREEPLGRVLFLLDTPPLDEQVLDYDDLLNRVQEPLMKHPGLEVAVMTFKANESGEVELVTTRQFDIIPTDEFNSLKTSLPAAEIRTSVPDLSKVLLKALPIISSSSDNTAGTLIVMPITNSLLEASKLDVELGRLLRVVRIKPLLLFPEAAPRLEVAGSFLQTSGARFVYRNDSSGPLNYASLAAEGELQTFVDNTFRNDHPIVLIDSKSLSQGEQLTSKLVYQSQFTQHRLAVVTSTKDVSQLTVKRLFAGTYRDCGAACNVTKDAIFFKQTENKPYSFDGQETALKISYNGSDSADVTVTWSEVNYATRAEELSVDVWSSEGRGPVADIPENARLVLYASVLTGDKQVLGRRINVVMDVKLAAPAPALVSWNGTIQLMDDGNVTGGDIKRDDSVFSYAFPDDEVFQKGTVITIESLSITSHSFPGESRSSPAVGARAAAEHSSPQSSALFTKNNAKNDCCGSYVLNPSTNQNHRINGFYLYLDSFADIVIERLINRTQPLETITTTTAPTTATASPTNATSRPTNVTSGPTTATSGPTNATSGPTNSTSGPTNATSDPTNATSDPTSAPNPTTLAGNSLAAPVLLLLFCATAAQLVVAAVRG